MNYPKEANVIYIIRNVVTTNVGNLAAIKNNINNKLKENNHPFQCTNFLSLELNNVGQTEISYYLENTDEQYENISGITTL